MSTKNGDVIHLPSGPSLQAAKAARARERQEARAREHDSVVEALTRAALERRLGEAGDDIARYDHGDIKSGDVPAPRRDNFAWFLVGVALLVGASFAAIQSSWSGRLGCGGLGAVIGGGLIALLIRKEDRSTPGFAIEPPNSRVTDYLPILAAAFGLAVSGTMTGVIAGAGVVSALLSGLCSGLFLGVASYLALEPRIAHFRERYLAAHHRLLADRARRVVDATKRELGFHQKPDIAGELRSSINSAVAESGPPKTKALRLNRS